MSKKDTLTADRDLGLNEYDRPCEGKDAHRDLVKRGEELDAERAERYGIYANDDGRLCYAGMPAVTKQADAPPAKPGK